MLKMSKAETAPNKADVKVGDHQNTCHVLILATLGCSRIRIDVAKIVF